MSTAASRAVPAADRRPSRILVVDDERSMRELLAIVLRREGYEVLLAENGRAAIELLEHEPVDLLISDIKMPDLSGVDVLRAAKKIDQDILGIMITAFASTETAVEAMRLGACDYLSKPFDIDLLKMKVREKIENRQLKQENVLLKRTLGWSRTRCTSIRCAARSRWCRSTAARCRRTCSSPSSSATCAARSPAPTATRRGSSRWPRRARSSSTRSAR